ncbi:MAG: nucleotidyl transferase AbiEii/AbiGii toxin family protein [Candidatus Peregrinibacteria bacterium]|nr:nucleotidyl transferase AbiEii/AbiGii toxin family protein [Candidatus Peregrinibacteria bacterium]
MNYELFLKAFRSKYSGIQDTLLLFQYLREELQFLILQILYTKTTYPVYFMGGTLLRLSYKMNRFSEDIDLSLDKPDKGFKSEQFYEDLVSAFSKKVTGFSMNGKLNVNGNVVKIMLSFGNILFDLGISPLQSQTIKIKIELDTNPPAYATYERRSYAGLMGDYMVGTYDISTTFAGKLSAILLRGYQKGRDYYDLRWYLERHPKIDLNLNYLNSNCGQQGIVPFLNKQEVYDAVSKRVKSLDIELMRKDLERFIIMDSDSFKEWLMRYIPDTLNILEIYKSSDES